MNRNCSVDVFRYICAILVVAIHTRPLEELNPTLGFLAADVIPRIGVPFFFAVSGYFYLAKLEKGEKPFRTQMKKVLGLYSTWSLFYYLIDFLLSLFALIFLSCFSHVFLAFYQFHHLFAFLCFVFIPPRTSLRRRDIFSLELPCRRCFFRFF